MPLCGTGMNPQFLFGCAEKKTAVHGQKKRRWGAKRRGAPYLLMIRGSQQETAGETFGPSVGRGPGLAETFEPAARDGPPSCVGGRKTDLTCFFPYCLALRRSQYFRHQCSTGSSFRCRSADFESAGSSILTRVVRSEAERTGQEVCQIRQPPRKPHPCPQLRGSTSLFPKSQAHPAGDLQVWTEPTRPTPVLPKPDRREGFGP